jgi:hypothetical protein
MPESKKTSPEENNKGLKAYDAAMSIIFAPLILGFAGFWICRYFHFKVEIGILSGAVLGFVLGAKKLIQYSKNKGKEEE